MSEDHSATPDDARHAEANALLGTVGVTRAKIDSETSQRASRKWWDADAAAYHDTHADFLGVDSPAGEFVWCPEGLHEGDWHLLGDIEGKRILEIGCGSAPCSRWLASHGAHPVGLDISRSMLDRGLAAMAAGGPRVPLIQAGAEELPFADESFDLACSAFGAVPFVADSGQVMREVHRVLKPGGRWVFSVNHPMRWIFPDDPGPDGLRATIPYFDRTPYVEMDSEGEPTYVEHHRTIGDRVREIVAAGLTLVDIIEPDWPEWLDREWGQWSPLRGEIFPGTAIFVTEKRA
ncbi:class I SAM-dependent methyltransferase [Nocardia seriolae]|uniref:2-polyprenyl-6-hydroxyphenol methylase n=1 Tax=Nocardia seriolae TaxID=37332 RepID=A0ABC8ATV1_9NOCA|nr:class I SAM-dependent methyltransferase [Nocardia seriolae]APA97637.1 2-polyprenyl-6-hydroxyphenol methylase [Nocardia seriolae]MTJ62519.1 methyltransferase domain-containing protein [Nocardia seriolae]MTJ72832.1 methyltransferase domain-containing protein [Nocardia seriolae]MTJ87418.1 methyltransferase domain-containing protein [Nocardia seriolae]MTK31409.1 methyltransferase domain-containing protein [Nocardia seriolae]